ncbi:MAG: chromosome condensation regulator RCC1, partial [Flavobacteriales bacterium]
MKRISIFISTILLYINSYAQQNWLQVECGTEFSIALRSDSALFSWGVNTNGQLGNNLATPSSTSPYLIDTNSKWRAISAGSFHSLGIKNNGTLWTWGFNGNGQLGTGSLLQEDVPVQIGTDSDWKSIDAGLANSFAIKNNGTLWVCGLNFHGQLGIGAAGADTSVLIQVGTDNTWKQISCGGLHVMGLKNNGTLWSWGYNGEGQVGDTTNFNKPSPVQITAATNWQSISAGYQFSTAIKTDGSIFSWGFNGNGQLGDN